MTDIVTRLRTYSPSTCAACDVWGVCGYGEPCDCQCHSSPCDDAADEIERLRRLGDDLAEALEWDTSVPYDAATTRSVIKQRMAAWEEARRG